MSSSDVFICVIVHVKRINYNLALGKTAEVNNGVVSDALHELENIEAKTNAWQLGLAVYF